MGAGAANQAFWSVDNVQGRLEAEGEGRAWEGVVWYMMVTKKTVDERKTEKDNQKKSPLFR